MQLCIVTMRTIEEHANSIAYYQNGLKAKTLKYFRQNCFGDVNAYSAMRKC